METILKAWLVDNAVTTENKDDKILMLESSGNVSIQQIYDEMKREDTGLRQETLEHVTNLFQRVVARLVLSGYNVNTGLFRATAQFTGVVEQGKWDPAKNSIYVSITQDKELRVAIQQTKVHILGEKGNTMYIVGAQDASTRATDGTCTAGRNLMLNGKMLKVVGTDPAVGVSLIDSKGVVVKLPADMLVVNNPSQLIILLPTDLTDGEYELVVTTQFSGGGVQLKTPRSVSKTITVGSGGGEPEDPTV